MCNEGLVLYYKALVRHQFLFRPETALLADKRERFKQKESGILLFENPNRLVKI